VHELNAARTHLCCSEGETLPIGVGFFAWRLGEQYGGPPPSAPTQVNTENIAIQLLDAALHARPCALWLSFGDDLAAWCATARQREEEINGHDERMKLFILAGNQEEARRAVEECGADVIVVQGTPRFVLSILMALKLNRLLTVTGNEAGGHGLSTSPPLLTLLSSVIHALPGWRPSNVSRTAPPVLGAGGLANGTHLAALLALGCSGAVYGTRFLLTPESTYTSAQKMLLLSKSGGDTVKTVAFDGARGTTSWPAGVDGRGIRNTTVEEWEAGEREGVVERYKQAAGEGDVGRIVSWAGTGVGLMKEVKEAGQLVSELAEEAREALRRVAGYVV
jgi:nitronate monooxygenase